jgi:methyl-accepting chemotaxis protein
MEVGEMDEQIDSGVWTGEPTRTEEVALEAFKSDLEDGFQRLASAATYLTSMSDSIEAAGRKLGESLDSHRRLEEMSRSAVEETRSLVSEMRAFSEQARAARDEAQTIQQDVRRTVTDLTTLTADLRARIAALAVLGQPLPVDHVEPGLAEEEGAGTEGLYAMA